MPTKRKKRRRSVTTRIKADEQRAAASALFGANCDPFDYSVNNAFSCPPWWPPLGEVLESQGRPPTDAHQDLREAWAEAWALVRRLRAEYLEVKRHE